MAPPPFFTASSLSIPLANLFHRQQAQDENASHMQLVTIGVQILHLLIHHFSCAIVLSSTIS
ncbi:hypothetical protein L484_008645 [Morus notabilis]|uniref:Uncharacterized protein n=1 Tax=Morus notabilis TaxID=981085 RepID=W9RUY2_9ROSA|nr:hypothetical protein L484_008645 [Morus notabilis]